MVETTIVISDSRECLLLGIRGTYETQVFHFNLTWLIEKYGEGTAVVMVKRPGEKTAYPAITTQDGAILDWTIRDIDTEKKGDGECEIFWYVNDALAKTVVYRTHIARDIGTTTENPPDPYQTWVEAIVEAGARAEAAINGIHIDANNILVFGESET